MTQAPQQIIDWIRRYAPKELPSGFLGNDNKVASQYLPSYVDDIIEVNDYASLPPTGETGKIYITIDNNNQYRWSGSSYIALSQPTWNKTGNAGTNPSTDFLGTTDNQDLVFRTNNLERWRMTTNGRLLSASSNIIMGSNAGNGTITGTNNVGIGGSVFNALTSGYNNTVVGALTAVLLTNGERNTLLGFAPMYFATDASFNVAVGYEAGRSTNTNGNVIIGYRNLYSNSTGGGNVCIGFQSGYGINSSINTIIGHNTGQGVTTGGNNTILGANVTGLSATLANHTIISDGSGNMRFVAFNDGNVSLGAGTSMPTNAGFKLDVNGTGRFSQDLTVGLTSDGTRRIMIKGYTNLGISFDSSYNAIDGNRISLTRRASAGGTYNDNTFLFQQQAFADGNIVPYKHHYVNPSAYYGYTNPGDALPSYGYDAGFMWFRDSAVAANMQMKLSPDNALNIYSSTNAPIEQNFVDAFQMYSRDIVAGNAAPHFRTENGNIIKLYRETTSVAAGTLVSNGGTTLTDTDTIDGYTLKQIVKALRNQGLLA